jgi:hypothetical protein
MSEAPATPYEEHLLADCPPSCADVELLWTISAGKLNLLWGSVFPRLAALEWAGLINMDGWRTPDLTQAVRSLSVQVQGDPALSNLFKQRLKELDAYFTTCPTTCIPFAMPAKGGYDFLVSSAGLEFFRPDPPTTEKEMFRYYTFRGTGRPAIGIPEYMAYTPNSGFMTALSTDSPTGPSQIIITQQLLSTMLQSLPQSCAEHRECFIRKFKRLIGHKASAGISLETYKCLVSAFRCWQLEGSVYRGMMVETPRIVASVWLERATGTSGDAKSYSTRFGIGTDAGLRRIFRERMETDLPGDQVMKLEVQGAPPSSNFDWDARDVMITNQGFFFPELRGGYPKLSSMLADIAAGRAGNPVFTDSRRPDGDE